MPTVRRMSLAATLLVTIALLSAPRSVAAAVTEITACEQTFSGKGVLVGDLDCSGFAGAAVTIEGGSLDLRGYALTGAGLSAVKCTRSCSVSSSLPGGTVRGVLNGISLSPASQDIPISLKVRNVAFDGLTHGIQRYGRAKVIVQESSAVNLSGLSILVSGDANSVRVIDSNLEGSVRADRVTLSDSAIAGGIEATKAKLLRAVVDGSTIESGFGGVGIAVSTKAVLKDSVVTGHLTEGIKACCFGRIRLVQSEVSNNGGSGIEAGTNTGAVLIDSDVTGNGAHGVFVFAGGSAKVKRSNVSANGLHGVFVSSASSPASDKCVLALIDSTASGNGTDPVCGVSETCADLAGCSSPNLGSGATCDTSYDSGSGYPGSNWGVCALD